MGEQFKEFKHPDIHTGRAGIYGQSLFPEGRDVGFESLKIPERQLPPPIDDETFQSMKNLGLVGSPMPTPEQLDPSIAQGVGVHPIFDIMAGGAQDEKSIGYGKLMDTLGKSQMKRAEGLSDARTAQMWKQFLNPNLGNQPRSLYTKTGTGFLPNLGGNWRGY